MEEKGISVYSLTKKLAEVMNGENILQYVAGKTIKTVCCNLDEVAKRIEEVGDDLGRDLKVASVLNNVFTGLACALPFLAGGMFKFEKPKFDLNMLQKAANKLPVGVTASMGFTGVAKSGITIDQGKNQKDLQQIKGSGDMLTGANKSLGDMVDTSGKTTSNLAETLSKIIQIDFSAKYMHLRV